jgi:crotonobetainyl-CoA:carnitine CoA-transferase CaiB-like acyl-CoA transferase
MQNEQPGWRPGPIFLHFPAPSMGACFLLAAGVLAALVSREETGRGQHVRTSLYQGALAYTTQIWQQHQHADAATRTMMQKSYPPGIHQGSVYECADGEWIHAATMSGVTPTRTVEDILGVATVDWAELMRDPELRARHDEELKAAYRGRRRSELLAAFHAAGLGAEAIEPMSAAFAHPQFQANGMAVAVDDPDLGATTQVGVPAVLARTPGGVRGGQRRPGADSREVLGEAGLSDAEIDKLVAAGIVGEGAP